MENNSNNPKLGKNFVRPKVWDPNRYAKEDILGKHYIETIGTILIVLIIAFAVFIYVKY